MRDLKLHLALRSNAKAPRRVRADLDRLDAPELEVLLQCLRTELKEPIRIFGHRVYIDGEWRALPDSTSFKLVRIPEIIDALKTPAERAGCALEVGARLRVLKAREAIDLSDIPEVPPAVLPRGLSEGAETRRAQGPGHPPH
jgi:hypothetical protein